MNISYPPNVSLLETSLAPRGPASQAKRITIVTSGFECGGIQKAVVAVAGELAARGHHVCVITFFGEKHDFFTCPPDIKRLSLTGIAKQRTPVLALPRRVRARLHELRAKIRATQPDVVIAHAPQINVQTLLAYRDGPIIVAEHGDVSLGFGPRALTQWRKALWYRLRRLTYGRAARVVSVSNAVDRNVTWLDPSRRALIPNPLTIQPDGAADALPIGVDPNRPWLISVGRLAHAKGFDILLSAFQRIAPRFPEWQLIIVGDGILRTDLEKQAKPLGNQVVFTGALANPSRLLEHARWFVMGSRYEGFPIAHGEALLCGVPVIATDCPSRPRRLFETRPPAGGIRELLTEGKGGVLVPSEDPSALAAALATCMSDDLLRARCASEATALAERFSLPGVVDRWEKLIREVSR